MNAEPEIVRDRMLAAYGADIRRWPAGRLAGLAGLAASADFRRRWRDARALDRTLALAAPSLADGARLERRLLAAMGVASAASARVGRISFAAASTLAAASLFAGVVVGGIYGGDTLDRVAPQTYAGLTESAWEGVVADAEIEETL